MDESLTIRDLYERFHERLALKWVTGQQGELNPLRRSQQKTGASLVGHLNIIHPNRLQIIGQPELDYLNKLKAEAHRELIELACDNKPVAIILADGLDSPEDLTSTAQRTGTPLFTSKLSSTKLISNLRYYLGSELAEKTTIHGVFMDVNGMGVLLTGDSNVGKSELALELVSRNHRLVADDAPEFFHSGPDTVRGRCPEVLRDFLEVRGLGLLNIRAMYGDSATQYSKDLRLIVNLVRMSEEDMGEVDRLKGNYRMRTILDVEIPEVTLPVASGRNLAVLVEAAVRDHILMQKGYNASESFIKRQNELIKQQTQE